MNVNGKRVTVPSYRVRKGDVVEIRQKSKEMIVLRHNLDTIARADCRRVFEQRYTAGHMARNYLDVYHRIAQSRPRLAHVA